MSEISFLAQLITNKSMLFSANAEASVFKMVPGLIASLDGTGGKEGKDNYKVLIAYQLTDQNALLNEIIRDLSESKTLLGDLEWQITNPNLAIEDLGLEIKTDDRGETTVKIKNPKLNIEDLHLKLKSSITSFQSLQIKNGHYILIAKESNSNFRLKITYPDRKQRIYEPGSEVLIGRIDDEKGIFPEVDLSPYLKNPLHISRQQAILFEEDDIWKIKLHPDSSSLGFIDNQKMDKKKNYEIRDDTEVKFGLDVNSPDVRIILSPLA